MTEDMGADEVRGPEYSKDAYIQFQNSWGEDWGADPSVDWFRAAQAQMIHRWVQQVHAPQRSPEEILSKFKNPYDVPVYVCNLADHEGWQELRLALGRRQGIPWT